MCARVFSDCNSGLLAAYCHDIDHTGMNNAFEINTASDLALLHSDDSVLEKHHAHMTFKVLLQVCSCLISMPLLHPQIVCT
jgi:3'5'-cyclic nucleotide phosphodiesterase